jgi:hypothetical protein
MAALTSDRINRRRHFVDQTRRLAEAGIDTNLVKRKRPVC